MDKLTSNSATVEISARVKDILRELCIDDWQSKPHFQHQNFAEQRWQHLKHNMNWYMNWHRFVLPVLRCCLCQTLQETTSLWTSRQHIIFGDAWTHGRLLMGLWAPPDIPNPHGRHQTGHQLISALIGKGWQKQCDAGCPSRRLTKKILHPFKT